MPLGVKGFTFADGLSTFGYAHANPFGFSVLLNSLERGVGVNGVCNEHFSSNVFGVAGESNSLSALTLLYGGETEWCLGEIHFPTPGAFPFTCSGEESSEFAGKVNFGIGLRERKSSRDKSKPCSILASHPELTVYELMSNSLS
jgi:hypothetical protein